MPLVIDGDAQIFSIDIRAYAVMSNHLLLVFERREPHVERV